MDIEALRSLLSAVRGRESHRRIVIFGSSSLLVSLASATPAELGVETTLNADLLLDPDEETARRTRDEALGSDSEYDTANAFSCRNRRMGRGTADRGTKDFSACLATTP